MPCHLEPARLQSPFGTAKRNAQQKESAFSGRVPLARKMKALSEKIFSSFETESAFS
jgi:hypothetical protein